MGENIESNSGIQKEPGNLRHNTENPSSHHEISAEELRQLSIAEIEERLGILADGNSNKNEQE